MKGFLLIILSCRVLSYAFPIFSKTEKATEEIKVFKNISSRLPKKFCGVDEIEELYSDSLNLMKKPRFGFLNVGAYSHFPRSPKWHQTVLTYSFRNVPRYLNLAVFNNSIVNALNLWIKETRLKIVWVPRKGDISISFYGHDHKPPFSEPVLAYAYGPGRGFGGDINLNGTVSWTLNNNKTFAKQETNVFITVAHEFGHSMGLGHSTVRGALMNKAYTPLDYKYAIYRDYTSLKLHDDDIAGIHALYGPPSTPSPKPNPVSSHTTTARAAVQLIRSEDAF